METMEMRDGRESEGEIGIRDRVKPDKKYEKGESEKSKN